MFSLSNIWSTPRYIFGPTHVFNYVNDIAESASSTLRLFAYLYRVIKSKVDISQLPCDLDHLSQWAQTWQMKFNLTKGIVIKCTRSYSIISRDYILQDNVLENRKQSTYLDITLNNTLSWSSHIDNIVSRATKTLNFIRCNLYKCSREVKTSAYISIVCPLMEYASIVWDPYQITYINSLEGIQRRTARWATSDYSYTVDLVVYLTYWNL